MAVPKRPDEMRPNRGGHGAGDWPGQVALEGPERQGDRAARGGRQRALNVALCLLQLSDVLRGEIPALVEVLDEAVASRDRLVEFGARLQGVTFGDGDRLALLLQLAQCLLLGGQGASMCLQPDAIQLGNRGDTARHAADRAHIV